MKFLNEILIEWSNDSSTLTDQGIIDANRITFDVPLEEICALSSDKLYELLEIYTNQLGVSNKTVVWNVEITHWVPVEKRGDPDEDKFDCSDKFIQLKEGMPEDVKDLITDNVRNLFYKKPGYPSRFELLYFLFHKQYCRSMFKDGYSNRDIFYEFIFYYIISGIRINFFGKWKSYDHPKDLLYFISNYIWGCYSFCPHFFNLQNIIKKMFKDAINPKWVNDSYIFPNLIVEEGLIYKWCLSKYGSNAHINNFWEDIFDFLNPNDDSKAEEWYEFNWGGYNQMKKILGIDLYNFVKNHPI